MGKHVHVERRVLYTSPAHPTSPDWLFITLGGEEAMNNGQLEIEQAFHISEQTD